MKRVIGLRNEIDKGVFKKKSRYSTQYRETF